MSRIPALFVLALCLPLRAEEAAAEVEAFGEAVEEATGAEPRDTGSIPEALGALLKLEWQGTALGLDRKHWEEPFQGKTPEQLQAEKKAELLRQGVPANMLAHFLRSDEEASPAQRLFEQLQIASSQGMGGGSGRSGSGDRIQMNFNAQLASGVLRIQGERFDLSLSPQAEGVPSVEFGADGQGGLRLVLGVGDVLAVIRQSPGGGFQAALLGGKAAFAAGEASFRDFYAKHRRVVDGELFPLLAKAGIVLPYTPRHPRVLQAALARLCPAEEERARTLILELDHDDFARREEATKALSEGYLRWRPLISAAAADPRSSEEARTRLRQVLDQHGGDDGAQAFLEAMKLLEDPEFLVSVLKAAPPADRKAVAAALARAAGEDLGAEPEAWEAWLAKRESGRVQAP